MRRRSFLTLSALAPFLTLGKAPANQARFGFAQDGSAFLLDGKPRRWA
ncbi:hypothetical protein [Lentzea sp. NPDC051838]